jgi:antitoxin component of MazEF toxin-antitoxin module
MKLRVRRIGNSLGVIVPKVALNQWGVGVGDFLDLDERSIRPPQARASTHEALDELKRRIAAAVVTRCTASEIRAHGLANLHRWKRGGVWISAYDEWKRILECHDDGELFAVMLGRDEHSNRLRQSPPYVGLLPRETVRELNEEATT